MMKLGKSDKSKDFEFTYLYVQFKNPEGNRVKLSLVGLCIEGNGFFIACSIADENEQALLVRL